MTVGACTGLDPEGSSDVLVDVGRSHTHVVSQHVDRRVHGGAAVLGTAARAHASSVVVDRIATAVPTPQPGWRLAVCAPGVEADSSAAQRFADDLAGALRRWPTPPARVITVADSAAWQVGAFAGGDGAAIAIGTGSVTVARIGDTVVRLDGRGFLLGDDGGGAWIGRRALRTAALEPVGDLHAAALVRFGPPATWPELLRHPELEAVLAAFVPDVVAAASAGDASATRVLDDAAAALTATIAPLPTSLPVCVVGGLAAILRPRLCRLSDRPWRAPAGDVIDGLRVMLEDAGPFAAECFSGRDGQARVAAGRYPAATSGTT